MKDICRNRYTSCVCVFKISRSRICNLVSDHREIAESSKRSRTRVYEIEIAMNDYLSCLVSSTKKRLTMTHSELE